MKITSVRNCIKIADVIKNTNKTKPLIIFDYKSCKDKSLLKLGVGRVYLFTSNKEIKKIGYSRDKGGIKNTLAFYQQGLGGRPSIRTLGIHYLLNEEIEKDKKVEVYMILAEEVKAKVRGLFEEVEQSISASHEMEERCKRDYYEIEGSYPDWNYQENNKQMPQWILEKHLERIHNTVEDNSE